MVLVGIVRSISGNRFDDYRQTFRTVFSTPSLCGNRCGKVSRANLVLCFKCNSNARCAAFWLFSWVDQIPGRMFGRYLGYGFVLTLSAFKAKRDRRGTINETAGHLGTAVARKDERPTHTSARRAKKFLTKTPNVSCSRKRPLIFWIEADIDMIIQTAAS